MRRIKNRLEAVDRLQSSLRASQAKVAETEKTDVDIPAEAYEKIAQIERAQITRERATSIQSGLEEHDEQPYFVQKSHEASKVQAQLDARTRLRVQDRIDALMTQPRPAEATEAPRSGILRVGVAETPVTVEYAVDDAARRVRVLAVRVENDDASSRF